jgi:hypothetical protein
MSQIEALMYAALGFVVALLLVFAFGRGVWSLSNFYAKRKREKDVPASMLEIEAEKNQLRAEHAVMARKLETGTEDMRAKVITQMAEVSRHRNRVLNMSEDLDKATVDLESQKQEAASFAIRVTDLENELADGKKALESLHEAVSERDTRIAELENALSTNQKTLADMRELAREREEQIDNLTAALENTAKTLEEASGQKTDLERRLATERTRQAEIANRLSVNTDNPLVVVKSKLADTPATRRIHDLAERALAERKSEDVTGEDSTTEAEETEVAASAHGKASRPRMPAGLPRPANQIAGAQQPNEFKSLITQARRTLAVDANAPANSKTGKGGRASAIENVVSLAQRIRAMQKKSDEKLSKELK